MEIIYTEKKYKGERFVQIKMDTGIGYKHAYYATYKFLTHKIGYWGFSPRWNNSYYRIYQNKTEYSIPL